MGTPFVRLFGCLFEKAFGKYYEGPRAPDRFARVVAEYRKHHPDASPDDWAEFARRLGASAYEAGWQRGYEHVERDPDGWAGKLPPELEGWPGSEEPLIRDPSFAHPFDDLPDTIEPGAFEPPEEDA